MSEKQMTVNEAIEILERDDEDMRRGFFCLNDFTAIEVLERFAKTVIDVSTHGLTVNMPDLCNITLPEKIRSYNRR